MQLFIQERGSSNIYVLYKNSGVILVVLTTHEKSI